MEPITSLPSNTYLPKHVHALANEWRTADQRVKDIRKTYAEALAALPQAKLDDAEALGTAALAGAPLPPDREQETAVRDRIKDAERRLPIVEADRDMIGRRLAVAMRADNVRTHLATATAADIRPALTAYLTALADAERNVRQAHQTLTQATAPLAVIDAIDTGAQVALRPVAPRGLPTYSEARAEAQRLAQRLDNLNQRKTPRMRHVLLADGRNVTVPRELAADMLRDGIVAEWLDGWPAEQPSRPVGNGELSNFTDAQTRFARRADRDDDAA